MEIKISQKLTIPLLTVLMLSLGISASEDKLYDPTCPVYYQDGSAMSVLVRKDINLRAVFINHAHKNYRAMINDKIFTLGDYIMGLRIVAIKDDGIVLLDKHGAESIVSINAVRIKSSIKYGQEDHIT